MCKIATQSKKFCDRIWLCYLLVYWLLVKTITGLQQDHKEYFDQFIGIKFIFKNNRIKTITKIIGQLGMGIGVQFQQLYAKMGSSREDHATKTRNFCFGFNSNERWFFENWKISKIWTHTTVVPKVTNLDYNNSQCTECNTKIQVQLGMWIWWVESSKWDSKDRFHSQFVQQSEILYDIL